MLWLFVVNPLMGTLKPQSNGPIYSSTVTVLIALSNVLMFYAAD